MKASSHMMWAGALGLALLGVAVSVNAQERGAFRESSGVQVQSAPARLTLDLDDVPLRDVLKTIAERSGVSLVYAASGSAMISATLRVPKP